MHRYRNHDALKECPQYVHVIFEALDLILENQVNIMSTLADIQAAQAITDQKITAITADVQTLLAKIAAIPPGGLTPDQQAAIDDIATHAGKINDALSTIDTTANPPPTA